MSFRPSEASGEIQRSDMKVLNNIDVSNKNVLVRLDLDVPITGSSIANDTRLLNTLPTVEFLLQKQVNVTIIGHVGRPLAKSSQLTADSIQQFSTKPIRDWYQTRIPDAKLVVAENLRFEAGEEANDPIFAEDIVRRFRAQFYVFDAFAASHDRHASIVQIPRLLPTTVGFRFQAELNHLQIVLSNPKRPLVFVIGGAKPDTKVPLVEKLAETADAILVGGTLPLKVNPKNGKMVVAKFSSDNLDITEESANLFAEKIRSAGTVIWNGPMGKFEDSGHELGTKMVAEAMVNTPAYTVAGGGDTEAAIAKFGASRGIDWISSGGGAMLHYLAYHTLPFLEAIQEH